MQNLIYLNLFLGLLLMSPESTEITKNNTSEIIELAKCKVLLPNLDGAYIGECKGKLAHGKGIAQGEETYDGFFRKGLPHGDGKYIYKNGEFYIGDFQDGKRHGEGVMHQFDEDTNALLPAKLAMWKNDEYVMDIMEKEYNVVRQRNLSGFNVDKIDEKRNSIEIKLRNHLSINNIDLNHSTGMYSQQGNRLIIDQCDFPIDIRLQYTTVNKAGESIPILAQFTLESAGRWIVSLTPM